jgi:acyl-CoA reductase-like NAD-dependent aldehyde dehydrogenase
MKVINPASGEIIQELKEDTAATVKEKFTRAQAAQPAWAKTPYSARKAAIAAFRELLVQRTPELARILTSEVGKPLRQSVNELKGVLGRIDFFLDQTESALSSQSVWSDPAQKMNEKISYEPLGVIANISAWNYPYLVGSNVFIPALLTGNAVLYKPSEFSSLTGIAIAEMMPAAGVPKDIFVPLIGGGALGAELLKQPIQGVFFTGSYATGKKISEIVGGQLIRTQFELGGKDPIYVTEDVDVAAAVEATADGAFYNAGQSCCSVERIYIHEKIFASFQEKFLAAVQGFKIGDPRDEATYIGPLTRPQQMQVLEEQIADAVKKGAKVLCGGKRRSGPGNYFEPTVLVNVNHSMLLMKEESFGPIIGLMQVTGDEEATRLMNDTDYGLTAGVYSRNQMRAEGILAQIRSGSVYWNCCDRVSPRLPWTGRGHSGLGSTLSVMGIHAFVQPKAWHLRG